jgi:hypothetical protein
MAAQIARAVERFRVAAAAEVAALVAGGMVHGDAVDALMARIAEEVPPLQQHGGGGDGDDVARVARATGMPREWAARAVLLRGALAHLRSEGVFPPQSIDELVLLIARRAGAAPKRPTRTQAAPPSPTKHPQPAKRRAASASPIQSQSQPQPPPSPKRQLDHAAVAIAQKRLRLETADLVDQMMFSTSSDFITDS